MSDQVVRVAQYNKASLGAIGKEVERDEKSAETMQFRNGDIDPERTQYNYAVKHTENIGGLYGAWKDAMKELNVTNAEKVNKTTVAFEGMIVTSNSEFFEKLGKEWHEKKELEKESVRIGMYPPLPWEYLSPEKQQECIRNASMPFFKDSYTQVLKEIGFHGTDANILSAIIHFDETTPHLQLYYVPVVDSWKEKVLLKDESGKIVRNEKGSPVQARDESGKLRWNEVKNSSERKLSRDSFWKNKGGKTSYTQMQDRFYDAVSVKYGLGRGEIGSTAVHKTKAQWEAEQLREQNKQLRKEKDELVTEREEVKTKTEELVQKAKDSAAEALKTRKETLETLEGEQESLKESIDALTLELERLRGSYEQVTGRTVSMAEIRQIAETASNKAKQENAVKSFMALPEVQEAFIAYTKQHPAKTKDDRER